MLPEGEWNPIEPRTLPLNAAGIKRGLDWPVFQVVRHADASDVGCGEENLGCWFRKSDSVAANHGLFPIGVRN